MPASFASCCCLFLRCPRDMVHGSTLRPRDAPPASLARRATACLLSFPCQKSLFLFLFLSLCFCLSFCSMPASFGIIQTVGNPTSQVITAPAPANGGHELTIGEVVAIIVCSVLAAGIFGAFLILTRFYGCCTCCACCPCLCCGRRRRSKEEEEAEARKAGHLPPGQSRLVVADPSNIAVLVTVPPERPLVPAKPVRDIL